MNAKYIINLACFILIFCAPGLAQNITQAGRSYRYNGENKETPLERVVIKCPDAINSSALSDESGAFTLEFDGRLYEMGDPIICKEVIKKGMIIFDKKAVEEWSIKKRPLRLILCDKDWFEKQKLLDMEMGRKGAEEKIAHLEAKNSDLEKMVESLKRYNDNLLSYAEEMTRVNLSRIDADAVKGVNTFRKGMVSEAVQIFEDADLLQRLRDLDISSTDIVNVLGLPDNNGPYPFSANDDDLYDAKQEMIMSIQTQITLYKLIFEWDKAGILLKKLADETKDPDIIIDYADYAKEQNQIEDAIDYYNKALLLYQQRERLGGKRQKYDIAVTMNCLGALYRRVHRTEESKILLDDAHDIMTQLYNHNHGYGANLASCLVDLAGVYCDDSAYYEADRLYTDAIEILRERCYAVPGKYVKALAAALNDFALLCAKQGDNNKAIELYEEATMLLKQEPIIQTYEGQRCLANILNNLSILQTGLEAKKTICEACDIMKSLAEINPNAYEAEYAILLNNMALYEEDRDKAIAINERVLQIRRRLVTSYPAAFESDLAVSLCNLGREYCEAKRYAESERCLLESIEIFRRLSNLGLKNESLLLASSLALCATLYDETSRQEEAVHMALESVQLLNSIRDNSKLYIDVYLESSTILAEYYKKQNNYNESKQYYLNIISFLKKNEKHPVVNGFYYRHILAGSIFELSRLYSDDDQAEKESLLKESILLFRELMQYEIPDSVENLNIALNELGKYYMKMGKLKEGESVCEEAIDLMRKLNQEYSTYNNQLARQIDYLAHYYSNNKVYNKSIPLYKEEIHLFELLSEENLSSYGHLLALAYISLLKNYLDNNEQDNATEILTKLITVFEKLEPSNPELYGRLIKQATDYLPNSDNVSHN